MNKFFAATLIIPAILGTVAIAPTQAQSSPLVIAQANDSAAIAQDFITLLKDGNYSNAVAKYAPASTVSSASLQQTWEDVIAANGMLQEQISAQMMGDSLVAVTCQFEGGSREVFVNVVNGQIVDFSISE